MHRLEESRSAADQILFGAYIGSSTRVREGFLRRLAALTALTVALKRAEQATVTVHSELSDLERGQPASGSWWFKPGMESRWARLLERFQSEGLFIVAGAYISQSPERCARFLELCRFNSGISPKLREAASGVEVIYARQRNGASTERIRELPWTRAAAGYLAGFAILIVAAILLSHSRAAEWRSYTTDVGEHRKVVLPDGSTVHLNTDSSLRFKQTKAYRVAELLAGEALFLPAKGAKPFVSLVSNLAIIDIGTQYTVRRYENGNVGIMVMEGEVSVSRQVVLHGPLQEGRGYKKTGVSIIAGQRAAMSESGTPSVSPVTPAEIERRDAWLDNKVVFDGTPLGEVVSELNRYNRRKMRIVDPRISGYKVSVVNDPRNLVVFLTKLPDIDVQYSTTGTGDNVSIELFALPKGARHSPGR